MYIPYIYLIMYFRIYLSNPGNFYFNKFHICFSNALLLFTSYTMTKLMIA